MLNLKILYFYFVMYLLFILTFLILLNFVSPVPDAFSHKKPLWSTVFINKTCSTETFPCPEVVNLLKKITKCNGLIICYPSLFANPYLLESTTKLNNRFVFNETNTTRICSKCIEAKLCNGPDGIKTEWNGFRLFYDKKENKLEVNLDIVGKRETLYLNDTTVFDFLQAIIGKNSSIFAKIKKQSKIDKEYVEQREKGSWLSDYLGVLALNIDLGIGFPVMKRDIAFGILYRRGYLKKCREVKTKTTSTAMIVKPTVKSVTSGHKNVITAITKYITPMHKIKATTDLATTATTAFVPVNPCKYFDNPKFAEKYSCKCEPTNFVINQCCERYHECIAKARENFGFCPSIPDNTYFISINVSNYYWKCDECLAGRNDYCQQAHCECDRNLTQCWAQIPTPKYKKTTVEISSCVPKLIEELKHSPAVPIFNVTTIRKNNKKVLEQLEIAEANLKPGEEPEYETLYLIRETNNDFDKNWKELNLADDVMYATLMKAVDNLKQAMKKAQKSNDEEDLIAAEIALDEYIKIKLAAVAFENEYYMADLSNKQNFLLALKIIKSRHNKKNV